MASVACGKYGVVGKRNAGNHRITQVTRPAFLLTLRHENGSFMCGGSIEGRDPAHEFFTDPLAGLKPDNKGMAALQSALVPGVSKKLTVRPLASVTAT